MDYLMLKGKAIDLNNFIRCLIFQSIVYIVVAVNIYSFEFLSSNGENYFKFNGNKNRIEKVDLDFNKSSYDIDFIKIGFFINGKQYEIGEEEYKLELLDDSNIIKISGIFEGNSYEINLYSSMLDKNHIVFNTKFLARNNSDAVSIYFYVKPKDMGKVIQKNDVVSFNDINFIVKNHKVYSADNTEFKEKQLKVINSESTVNKNQGIFIMAPINLSEDGESNLVINKKGFYKKTIKDEKNYWVNALKGYKEKALYSNLFMFMNGGLIIDASGETPIINMDQTMKLLELSLLKKDYTESKIIMEHLIFLNDKDIEGIIPSNFVDMNGKSVSKADNYGVYNSIYRRFLFLKLYVTFLSQTSDKEFFDKTYSKIKTNLVDWLEKKMNTNGVIPDSGNDRIGEDGYKNFVETQYEAYKSFKLLNSYLTSIGIKDEKYKKIAEKLKEIMILYYVDGYYIVDYPFAKNVNPKNIFYVDEDLFFNNSDYYRALQKNIELLKKETSTLNEKITFVNYLYDKKYFLMADSISVDIEKELEGYKGIELLQKDLSLLLNYLIMKEKGEKYGLNK